MINIDVVINETKRMGEIINAPKNLIEIHTLPLGDGTPYIEIKDGECFYISSERGYEIFRKKVNNLNNLLYLIFDRITTRMAGSYELENRVNNQDCRRMIFSKRLELLEKISCDWKALKEVEIKKY